MNAFQILDANGKAISINSLDKEVCELVGVDVDKKHYCKLGKREDYDSNWDYISKTSNWFDTIGWLIASKGLSLQGILDYYADSMKDFIGKKDEDGNIITLEVIYPYHTKVLNAWINKGYQAKQIIQ